MSQASELYGVTAATNSGLLTATGAETVYDTTVIIDYSIESKGYRKAAVTDGATPTTGAVSAAAITLTANHGRTVVWTLNSVGTVSVHEGDIEDLDAAGNFVIYPSFPAIDLETYCPFAYMVLKGGSTLSGTWTFGSSNWNATGLTATIVNTVNGMPRRPQIS